MENNLFAYIQRSKLGTLQIRWLSKLVLFDFTFQYRTGNSKKAADALNQHLLIPDSSESDMDSDEVDDFLFIGP